MDDSPRPTTVSRRRFHVLAGGWLAFTLSGCGTLMHPERIGQSRDGRLDWTIVGMNAIGLIFFFVPGVIAFAIDFYNGTIFYPVNYGSLESRRKELKTIALGKPSPTLTEIAQAISREVGRPVHIEEGQFVRRELEALDDFWTTHDALAGLAALRPSGCENAS